MTRIVLASGVFDVLHPGHIAFLEDARKHGDSLTVVVTSDEQAAREKRSPRHSVTERVRLVGALRCVDAAWPGREPYDLVETVRSIDPAIIVLGHDQKFGESELKAELAFAGLHVPVIRCAQFPSVRTSELLHRQ